MKPKRLICIVGPTAVGKTELAVRLGEKLGTEIISADSRQIFKELTIGTAKPSPHQLARVKHHFINSHELTDGFDAGQFGRAALVLLHELFKTHDDVILCGGSGLYVKALTEGFDEMPDVPGSLREQISNDYMEHGLAWLQAEVANADPEFYAQVDQQNPMRLMRALELLRITDQPLAALRKKKKHQHSFEIVKIGLETDREVLYHRIDERMDKMIAEGLFEEAKQFYSYRHLNALQTVGYQEIFGYLEGGYNKEEAVRLLKRNSRRYAKRQLTWFKKDKEIQWLNASSAEEANKNMLIQLGVTNANDTNGK